MNWGELAVKPGLTRCDEFPFVTEEPGSTILTSNRKQTPRNQGQGRLGKEIEMTNRDSSEHTLGRHSTFMMINLANFKILYFMGKKPL